MYSEGNLTVMVSDVKRSVHFYTEVLGLKKGRAIGEDWVEIEAPNLRLGIHPSKEKFNTDLNKRNLSIGLRVDDLDEAIEILKKRGVKFLPLFQDQGAKIAPFHDPDGTPMYLIELKHA